MFSACIRYIFIVLGLATLIPLQGFGQNSKDQYMLSTDWHLPDEDSVEYFFPSTLSSEIRQGIKAAHADMFEYFGHWGHKFFVLSDDSAASTTVLTELCKAYKYVSSCDNIWESSELETEKNIIRNGSFNASASFTGVRPNDENTPDKIVYFGTNQFFWDNFRSDVQRIVVHESIHVFQISKLLSRGYDYDYSPRWYWEGMAEYIALRVHSEKNYGFFIDSSNESPSFPDMMETILRDKGFNMNFDDLLGDDAPSYDAYVWAIAYLVSLSSEQTVLIDHFDDDIYLTPFNDRFEELYGMTVEQFKTDFAQFMEKTDAENLEIIEDEAFSDVMEFPKTVTPSFPSNESPAVGTLTSMTWSPSNQFSTYTLEVAKDSLFSGDVQKFSVSDTSYHRKALDTETPYYWRVKPTMGSKDGSWSKIYSFTTGLTTSIEESDLPTSFSLSQNYPNPFNPSTQIQFTIPQASHVKIEVFNMLGQSVGVLVNGVRQQGTHSIEFSGDDLSSGVYMYRMSTPTYNQSRFMHLVK